MAVAAFAVTTPAALATHSARSSPLGAHVAVPWHSAGLPPTGLQQRPGRMPGRHAPPPPPNAPERAHRTASACTVLAKRSAGCTGPLPGFEGPAQCRQLRLVGRPTVQWANAPVAKLCTGCTAMRRAAQGLAPHTPAHPVRAVKHRLPFALHLLHTLRQNTSAIAQRLLRALFLQNGFLRCMCVRVRAHSAVRPCALLKLGVVVPLRLL